MHTENSSPATSTWRKENKNMSVSYTQIDNQLWALKNACYNCKSITPYADWVLYAVERHIGTGRATAQFVARFSAYPQDRLQDLVLASLKGDASEDGIIRKVKRIISAE